MADEDDATFYVGALRCRAQASWNVKIGVRQLPKAAQAVVKMRVGVGGPRAGGPSIRAPPVFINTNNPVFLNAN